MHGIVVQSNFIGGVVCTSKINCGFKLSTASDGSDFDKSSVFPISSVVQSVIIASVVRITLIIARIVRINGSAWTSGKDAFVEIINHKGLPARNSAGRYILIHVQEKHRKVKRIDKIIGHGASGSDKRKAPRHGFAGFQTNLTNETSSSRTQTVFLARTHI